MDQVIGAVLTFGLPDSARVYVELAQWDAIQQWALSNRMTLLLAAAIDEGHVVPDPSVDRATLDTQVVARTFHRDRLDEGLRSATSTLRRASIDYRTFKGAATARVLYASPVRDYSDADIVVREAEYRTAAALLQSAGWLPSYRYSRPERAERVATSQNFADRGHNIDLHRAVCRQPIDERIGNSPFDSEGREVDGIRVLSEDELTVCAALDLVFGGRVSKPWAIRDCLQGLHVGDEATLARTAARWHVTPFVAVGLDAAGSLSGRRDLVPAWAADEELSDRDAHLIQWFRDGPSWRFHLAVAQDMTGWKQKLDYLRTFTPTVQQLRRSRLSDLLRRELTPQRRKRSS